MNDQIRVLRAPACLKACFLGGVGQLLAWWVVA